MLGIVNSPLYPSCSSAVDLANNFIGFFAHYSITTIRYELDSNPKQGIHIFDEASVATTKLHRFTWPPLSTLLKILPPLASKCCELDPVPSSILLDCLDLLGPVIWKIVNLSLETSVMPTEVLQGLFILAVDTNMSLLCLSSYIGSPLNRGSLLKLLSLHSRLFMVLHLIILLSS